MIIYRILSVLIFSLIISTIVSFAQIDQRQANLEKATKQIKAIRQGDDSANAFYNAACYLALGGKADEAFSYLDKAIEHGYSNAAHLKEDSDLISLRDDKRWTEIVAKTEAKKKIESLFYNREDFYDGAVWKTPYRENLSEDEKVAGLSKFWSEVKYNFVNFDLVPDVNWDALYLEYLPKIRQTGSTVAYYKLMFELCAKLSDGHTNVIAPAELADELIANPLIATRLIEDKVLIIRGLDDSVKQAGIETGQEILEIDGIPVKEYAEKNVKPYLSASTIQGLEVNAFGFNLLAGSVKSSVELTLRDAAGKTLKRTLPRVPITERNQKSTARLPFELKILPGNIAYVALNSFGDNEAARMFAEQFTEISKADAIIFDVRENLGGNSQVGWNILGFLTDKPFAVTKWYTRDYRPSYRAWSAPQTTFGNEAGTWQANGKNLYTKSVVVLTSPRTFSAAEDFTGVFSIMKRGKIIGEPTGGSTGQPLVFNLPGGGTARVCTKRDKFPDGRDFVGKGIQPDIIIKPTVADFRSGRDTVLEAALKQLKK